MYFSIEATKVSHSNLKLPEPSLISIDVVITVSTVLLLRTETDYRGRIDRRESTKLFECLHIKQYGKQNVICSYATK